MPRLLERSIRCVDERLVLLAPPHAVVSRIFKNVENNPNEHRERLQEIQRLRGDIYLTDGAVKPEDLSQGGLHQTPEDEKSWHLLMLNKQREITACVWYLAHPSTTAPNMLRARHCPAGLRKKTRAGFWSAVNGELERARLEGLSYAEVGGWAVTKGSRCTSEGLVLALAAYSLGRLFGGALGMTTATVRHSSATILRHLGGAPLLANGVEVAPYYDPKYKCQMEVLRFDSRVPNPKYDGLVDLLKEKLASALVVASQSAEARLPRRRTAFQGNAQEAAA